MFEYAEELYFMVQAFYWRNPGRKPEIFVAKMTLFEISWRRCRQAPKYKSSAISAKNVKLRTPIKTTNKSKFINYQKVL